jgi:hypothetical protein
MFYTYTHARNDDGTIFYVGKGKGRRAFQKSDRGQRWNQIVSEHGYTVKIVQRFEIEDAAFDHERELIYSLRKSGHRLINITEGGEGASGHKHPEYVRQKRRATILSEPVRRKILEALPRGADHHASVKVICIETAMAFDSAMDALRWVRSTGRKASSAGTIVKACKGQFQKIYGYHWKFAIGSFEKPVYVNRRFIRPVICLDTGRRFASITDAQSWLISEGHAKAATTALSRACSGVWKQCYGYRWKYDVQSWDTLTTTPAGDGKTPDEDMIASSTGLSANLKV